MPELPEVETIKNQLSRKIPAEIKTVDNSSVSSSIIKAQDFSEKGLKIKSLRRKGKMLIFEFEKELFLLSHLGMSGSWRISKEKITEKHTHLQWELVKGKQVFFLAYIDPRRFGKMYFLEKKKAQEKIDKLGVDISSSDYTAEYLRDIFKRFPERQLKPFLLEQKYFSGIGNYIACEICALAGLRPTRRLKTLSKKSIEDIIRATDIVISGQLQHQGMSFSGGYKDAFGNDGGGLNNLVVFYQDSCGICKKTLVKKITLAGRGTYYCPHCQS